MEAVGGDALKMPYIPAYVVGDVAPIVVDGVGSFLQVFVGFASLVALVVVTLFVESRLSKEKFI